MLEEYVKRTDESDPVYCGIFWKSVDDSPHNRFLCYTPFLQEQLDSLREGRMPIEVYNNFREKGVLGVLFEMLERDDEESSRLTKELFSDD